jgi:ribosome-associated toxin RatA of RatAB toxin-antitoxin module
LLLSLARGRGGSLLAGQPTREIIAVAQPLRSRAVKPVTTSVEVPNSPHQVYEFLEVLGNHQRFMDHFMVDWELSGPERGVGAKANVRVKATAETDRTDVEIVEADAGRKLVEETIGGSRARRRTRGTYLLEELPDGGTRISFELEFLELPTREKVMGPLNRLYVRRVNARGMKRLAAHLTSLCQ